MQILTTIIFEISLFTVVVCNSKTKFSTCHLTNNLIQQVKTKSTHLRKSFHMLRGDK